MKCVSYFLQMLQLPSKTCRCTEAKISEDRSTAGASCVLHEALVMQCLRGRLAEPSKLSCRSFWTLSLLYPYSIAGRESLCGCWGGRGRSCAGRGGVSPDWLLGWLQGQFPPDTQGCVPLLPLSSCGLTLLPDCLCRAWPVGRCGKPAASPLRCISAPSLPWLYYQIFYGRLL